MENSQKVKKIVFLDTLTGLDKYLSDTKGCLFIAMNPSVYFYLKQGGAFVENTLAYFSNDSHARALEKSKILVDWLRENTDFVEPELGIQHGYRDLFIYWIRPVIHYYLWSIEIITNAVERHRPQAISAPLSHRAFVPRLTVEPQEGYLGDIVEIIAREKGLTYENTIGDNSAIFSQFIPRLKNWLYALIKYIVKYAKFQLSKNALAIAVKFSNKKPALFTTKLYQMDKLIEETRAEYSDTPFYYLEGPVIPSFRVPNLMLWCILGKRYKNAIRQKKIFKNLIKQIDQRTDTYSFNNIPFAGLISRKIKDNIIDYGIGLYLWSGMLEQCLDALKPALIISNGSRLDDSILAELCLKRKIPTIMISHGSHVRPKNELEKIEWEEHGRALLSASFSFLALQSPLAESYLEYFPSLSRAIKTGPLIWGGPIKPEISKMLFKKMFNGKYDLGKIRIILHAATPKPSNSLRLQVYETPDEYIRSICELADAVKNIPNTILIVKFRLQSEIPTEDLRRAVPFSEKIVLSIDEPFNELLGMSDLLVSFSSTTIEEALQNRIPVLLYGGNGRYQHIPAHEINSDIPPRKSAVYHVKEAGQLEYAIGKILDLHKDANADSELFNSYIYPQNSRTSLIDLLKSIS